MLLLALTEAEASKAAELDGELLACCADAAEADREASRIMDLVDGMSDDDPALLTGLWLARPLVAEYDAAADRARELLARTPEGLRAKARLLLLHLAAEQGCEALAGSLARDVAGRAPA